MNEKNLAPVTPVSQSTAQHPSQYKRRILLAVSGLSPQIVTETIYALAASQDAPFVPTEVHLITTREGANRAELSLLSDDLGWFHRLCKDYNLTGIQFTRKHIHIMRDANERGMDDIRSIADNRAAADFITQKVREFSADPDCALHVSIAGGRKTMGFYLGYALSLYGRAQDRLSHVLVSEPFENSMDFFYPTPYSRVLTLRDNKLADAVMAEVTLAEIPFVSLRHGLPAKLLSGHASFVETVVAAQAALAAPELVINMAQRSIRAGGQNIELPPAEMALLAVFARRAIEGKPSMPAPCKTSASKADKDANGPTDRAWASQFLREYRACHTVMDDMDATERALKNGMDGEYFSQRKSKLERRLKAALGPAARHYCIDDGGTRPRKYRLTLSPESVRFETDAVTNMPHGEEAR